MKTTRLQLYITGFFFFAWQKIGVKKSVIWKKINASVNYPSSIVIIFSPLEEKLEEDLKDKSPTPITDVDWKQPQW